MLAPLIWMANPAAVPQAPSYHDGTGAHRGAGVPRKRRRRVDPEFTLEKPKKPEPIRPREPEASVATMERMETAPAEAEPTPAPEIVLRPLTRKIKRLKGVPAVRPVVDTLAVDMLLAEVAQRVRDEQEEDEAIIAFLLSHL